MHFSFDTSPARVLFGRGTARTALPPEVERMGVQRVLVVADRSQEVLARTVTEPLAEATVGWFTDVETPAHAAAVDRAVALASRIRADGVVGIGGGVATGTARIVARENRLPVVSVPTTYAGTETTPLWAMAASGGWDEGGRTSTHPRAVILDPDLTDALPRELAVASALSAMALTVEAYWAPRANPMSSALADDALAALAGGLRGIGRVSLARATSPEVALVDPVATWAGTATSAGEQLLYGSFLAGSIAATTGVGLHHRICQVLVETFRLPSALTHAVVLPHVLALNVPALPKEARRIARALDAEDAVAGLRRLYADIGAPSTLEQLGLRYKQLPEAIDRAGAALPVANPRPVGTEEVRAVITAAFDG